VPFVLRITSLLLRHASLVIPSLPLWLTYFRSACFPTETRIVPTCLQLFSPLCAQTVEAHLLRLGARHVEGCGAHEDHHEFSLEEIEQAVQRVRILAETPAYQHACIVLTEKDYARQVGLWTSVFSKYSGELATSSASQGSTTIKSDAGPDRKWGAYVLHSELEVVDSDRRFSSQKAALAALLHLTVDNFRRRSYMGT
jgi:hypothetical protein